MPPAVLSVPQSSVGAAKQEKKRAEADEHRAKAKARRDERRLADSRRAAEEARNGCGDTCVGFGVGMVLLPLLALLALPALPVSPELPLEASEQPKLFASGQPKAGERHNPGAGGRGELGTVMRRAWDSLRQGAHAPTITRHPRHLTRVRTVLAGPSRTVRASARHRPAADRAVGLRSVDRPESLRLHPGVHQDAGGRPVRRRDQHRDAVQEEGRAHGNGTDMQRGLRRGVRAATLTPHPTPQRVLHTTGLAP